MKGNFHVRFLGEGMRGNTLPLPDNLTSQFWANVYLNGLDHFVKRELKCGGYVRYVDDLLLFDNDPERLKDWALQVKAYLNTLRLTIHDNRALVRPTAQGLPFLGFTIYADYRRLKRLKGIAYYRRLKGLMKNYEQGETSEEAILASLRAWSGHIQHGDTWSLHLKLLEGMRL